MVHLRFDPAASPQSFSTVDGLRVRLLRLPAGSQAAALVRVHAGAHDAPSTYPGLAHFLEHLLFLGSHAFPVEQSLMPFVQGRGGQLNASTRERHTDFFFQLAAEELQGGLQRLLDMLARPLLDPAAQLREREVLQAEYLARARDGETLCDAAIGTALRSPHPFAAFHAGNRASLPVESTAFQQALRAHHQRFFHADALELLVAAPVGPDELHGMLQAAECRLPSGTQVPRPLAPLLAQPCSLRLQLDSGQPRLDVAFCLDGMPTGSAAALDVLRTCLQAEAAGSLMATLRDAGWIDRLELRVPYWHAGQGVVVVEFGLTAAGMPMRACVVTALQQWLRLLDDEAALAHCWAEYLRVRQRGLVGMDPLTRLRHWVEPEVTLAFSDAATVQQALRQVLTCLRQEAIVLTADQRPCAAIETAGFPLRIAAEPLPAVAPQHWQWRLPANNPWLQGLPALAAQSPDEPALRCLGAPDADGQGAVYLRWRFVEHNPSPALWHMLSCALRAPTWAARQAGVELRFEDFGSAWCLSLFGYAAALPVIVRDLSVLLREPSPENFAAGPEATAAAVRLNGDELLVRQLIRRLPRLLGDACAVASGEANPSALADTWAHAHWDALAVGLSPALNAALRSALQQIPGIPQRNPQTASVLAEPIPRRWWRIGEAAEETAVLLFCPLPARDAPTEAAWRVLARVLEGDFFRRLRSELQLGYAVFSGFRQFGEQAGILFAVQSPSASAGQIISHIQAFLDGLVGKLAVPRDRLVGMAGNSATDLRQHAERCWQACLADRESDHCGQVSAAMGELQAADLDAALDALRSGQGGWVAVANAPAPGADWKQS